MLPSLSKRLNSLGSSDTRIYPCCTSIKPYDDTSIAFVLLVYEILERCENSRCTQIQIPEIIKQKRQRLKLSLIDANDIGNQTATLLYSLGVRDYTVESKKLFLDLGGLAPEIVNLNILQILLSY